MVLDLCSCSISTIDDIIQLEICILVLDPIAITTLELALCCEQSWMAYGSKEVVFRKHFIIIKAFIWEESTHWKVDSCIYSFWIVVSTIMLKHNDQYNQVGVNTCGPFWCFELLQFLQSLLSICSVSKTQFSKSFKDIDGLSRGKDNIISMKLVFL